MEQEKQMIFHKFTEKAAKRLEEKKVRRYETLYVPSLDEQIKIRNLDYPEIVECTQVEEDEDPNAADKYTIYLAVVEPDLRQAAKELKDQGKITKYTDIVDIFELSEITEIAMEVLKLSKVIGNKKVEVVKELKNS